MHCHQGKKQTRPLTAPVFRPRSLQSLPSLVQFGYFQVQGTQPSSKLEETSNTSHLLLQFIASITMIHTALFRCSYPQQHGIWPSACHTIRAEHLVRNLLFARCFQTWFLCVVRFVQHTILPPRVWYSPALVHAAFKRSLCSRQQAYHPTA